VFYLSTQATGSPTPGLLNFTSLQPTGTLHIWASSDVRLAGVSLDLIETGGGIRFTELHVPNPEGPPARWAFLDGPQEVTNSAVRHIGGAAVPGVLGDGIGAGSTAGESVLLASVNYVVTSGGNLQFALRVGTNGISDFDGNFAQLRFGSPSAPIIVGDQFGATGNVGGGISEPVFLPPVVVDANLGDRGQGSFLGHTFATSSGATPVAWSNLIASGPASPVIAPTLTSGGVFTWNSAGSALGQYHFDVTATNPGGTDVGRLSLNLVAPPPEPPILLNYVKGARPNDFVIHTFSATDSDTPLTDLTWSNFVFEGADVAIVPTFDPLTRSFSWNTAGSPDGLYAARVTVSDPTGGSDTGTLFISLGDLPGGEPELPEPATMTHLILTIIGLLGLVRKR
jgi:hypothetical protein